MEGSGRVGKAGRGLKGASKGPKAGQKGGLLDWRSVEVNANFLEVKEEEAFAVLFWALSRSSWHEQPLHCHLSRCRR